MNNSTKWECRWEGSLDGMVYGWEGNVDGTVAWTVVHIGQWHEDSSMGM